MSELVKCSKCKNVHKVSERKKINRLGNVCCPNCGCLPFRPAAPDEVPDPLPEQRREPTLSAELKG